MRTVLIVLVGLLLAFLLVRLSPPARRRIAAIVFWIGWLLLTLWNFRTGLAHGHSVAVELPIHLAIFGVPALAAWWFARPRPPTA